MPRASRTSPQHGGVTLQGQPELTTGPSSGKWKYTLRLDANSSFVYTPNANFNGPGFFTYNVSNGGAGADTCSKDTGDKAVSCERRQ